MKITQRLFLFIALFFTLQNAQAQNTGAEDHVRKFFTSLKAKDEKLFLALYPNATQFANLMRTTMQQMLATEEVQQAMAMDPKAKDLNLDSLIETEVSKLTKPEVFAEMQKSFSANFNKTIAKGESKGVSWSDAAYTGVTIDSSAHHVADNMEVLKNAGFKTIKGVIDFRSAGTDYQMSFDKIIFIPSEGWFGGEFPQIAKKGESLAPDMSMEDVMTKDSIDSVVYEKPKTKSKTKTKTPTTKTKTTTKTPARKPATKS